jgi:adenine-specific DNA-methyltransferase
VPYYDELSKEELLKIVKKQEKELKSKKYGLVWDSEREPEQVVLDCEDNLPVLKRIKGKEIKTDNTEDNIIIEGDNYHALTVLNYTHKEKIDVIYIDPPYNTGKKDFRYNDKYVELDDGYRHSKWLNFMEKRLNLAKNLLKNSGILVISIDDNEVAQLKMLCDKIFDGNTIKNSRRNFIAILPTIMNLKGNNDQFAFSGTHEYTLVYAKDSNSAFFNEFMIEDEEIESNWEQDEIGYFKKGAPLRATGNEARREDRPYMFYPILINNDKAISTIKRSEFVKIYDSDSRKFNDIYLEELKYAYEKEGYNFVLPLIDNQAFGRWRWGFTERNTYKLNTDVTFIQTQRGITLYKKQRPDLGDLPSRKPKSVFYKPAYSSGNGTSQLKAIFSKKVFENPKPLDLIRDIIYLCSKKDALVLDFMAGSGTTGHAVLNLNREDNGNRKFILCTNNENNICTEVTYPRIKKVIEGYKKNGNGVEVGGLGGNLQYFNTDFVRKTKNRDQVKVNLTKNCTEMLCVKENIFNLKLEEDDFKIFSSNENKRFLCIYYNIIEDSFTDFIEAMKKIEGEKIIYMFSIDNTVNKSLFHCLKDLKIEAIPQSILDVYRQLAKMNIPVKANLIFTEFSKAETKIFKEKDKDEGARILRIVLEKTVQRISQDNGLKILNEKGKEEKVSNLNASLFKNKMISKVEWEENNTYFAIGNEAAHGNYDDYTLIQVEKFYKHIQTLINTYEIR